MRRLIFILLLPVIMFGCLKANGQTFIHLDTSKLAKGVPMFTKNSASRITYYSVLYNEQGKRVGYKKCDTCQLVIIDTMSLIRVIDKYITDKLKIMRP